MKKLTRADLKAVIAEYDAAQEAADKADQKRAKVIAEADAQGMPQKDIVEATGYSRETVRRLTRKGQGK